MAGGGNEIDVFPGRKQNVFLHMEGDLVPEESKCFQIPVNVINRGRESGKRFQVPGGNLIRT